MSFNWGNFITFHLFIEIENFVYYVYDVRELTKKNI